MESEVQPSAREQHRSFLLRQLARMRTAEELTDVVLLAEGISFPCHKVVLSAFSPYFQAMFTCGLKETRGGEVALRDTAAQSLELLLKYMYSAELPLCNDNIQGVAAAAFLLHVDGAFRLCQSHMEAHMDASNCVGLYYWARDLGATDLADCALKYICQHFTQVCEEEEVLDLDSQRLGTLLGSDDLNISQEELVLELVLRWVERHRNNSQSETQAVELLRRVRLELVDPGFLRKARRRNPTYYIPSPLRDCGGQGQVTAGAVTRDSSILVAVEAEDQHRRKRLDIYKYSNSEEKIWVKLCSAPYRDMYALGLVGDALYLIGGQMKVRNHYVITDNVDRWSLKRGGSWLSFAPLPLALACHCTVSLKERLYVLGGWTPQDQPDDEPDKLSNRVFRFDPSKDSWTECARMKYSRYRCGTAVLNGEIYILGGIGCVGEDCGQSRRCLSSVEIYNPDADSWRPGPTLPTTLLSLRTNGSNTGTVEGKLYLCGYYKGVGRHEIITKEILELDPADYVWTVVERRAVMHDSYDVCLVANLNPRDLLTP
ncbi:kelch repeat and BTB domain-containing protein 12-like isoform X3 [Gambusia affinis]|uniref:kelch repeat and BTB domain-containing protein 12-like isoform X3 n=1 Tax=Gambusia affinis TaxID=33528 RepID=UPI001CDBCA11|nr:kelch repeat and BTB domain-containing protein 12-like isoform X3 [Gambusia affinis]